MGRTDGFIAAVTMNETAKQTKLLRSGQAPPGLEALMRELLAAQQQTNRLLWAGLTPEQRAEVPPG